MVSRNETHRGADDEGSRTRGGTKANRYPDLPEITKYVNAAHAAEIAGVSRQYMHAQRRRFRTACTISGFLHFERDEIMDWAEGRVRADINGADTRRES